MTCTARTAKGTPCRRPALRGREVCHAHSGAEVGRRPVLTPELHARLVRAKKVGSPDWVAAQSAGISRSTYYELLRRGRAEASGPYRELVEAIEQAEADAYLGAMAVLHRELRAPGNYRAALAYLDRVDRGRFSGTPEAGARSSADAPERLEASSLPDELVAGLERAYEASDEEREDEAR